MQLIENYFQQLKLRLTDISQRNRSLKLLRLSPLRDFDLESISLLNNQTCFGMIDKLIKNQSVVLIKQVDPQLHDIIAGDIRLNRIHRTLHTIYEESGTYDLKLGFPFVFGKLLDNTIVRSPLLFLPARLVKSSDTRSRWILERNNTEEIHLNPIFFRAYEKINQHLFPDDFWEIDFSESDHLQAVILQLYEIINQYNISIKIDSQLFTDKIQRFSDWTQEYAATLPLGVLTAIPEVVLGIFPQADAAIVQDYTTLSSTYAGKIPDFSNIASSLEPILAVWPGILPQDSSQEEVLQRLRQGVSVAVNGPPGSGKSQMIVNALTEFLAFGKTVLVVSQKRSALDVVLRRLQEIGIAPFALCIHDYQNDRSAVYKQLTFQIAQIRQYETEVKTLEQVNWESNFLISCQKQQNRFDFHENIYSELLKVQPCGLRLFDLYCTHPKPENPIPLPKTLQTSTWAEWQNVYQTISRLSEFWEILTQNSFWKNRKNIHNQLITDITHNIQESVDLACARESLPVISPEITKLTQTQAQSFLKYAEFIDPAFRNKLTTYIRSDNLDIVNQAFENIPTLEAIQNKLNQVVLLPLENVPKIIEFLNHLDVLDDLQDSIFKILKSSWHTSTGFVNQFLQRFNLGQHQLAELRQEALIVRECAPKLAVLKRNPLLQDWPEIPKKHLWEKQLSDFKNYKIFWLWLLSWEHETQLFAQPDSNWWENTFKQAKSALDSSHINQKIQSLLEPFLANISQKPLYSSTELKEALVFLGQHSETLQLADSWYARLNKPEQAFIQWFIQNPECLPTEKYLKQIEQTLVFIWVQDAEIKKPFLREASTTIWENLSHEVFQEDNNLRFFALELLRHHLKQRILTQLKYNQRNNLLTFRDLNHQITKKSKIWPIRKLFQHFWESEIQYLAPCVLASPETVSAIFEMKPHLFDLVIFDEASQCLVERAIPTFLRGKQVLVAGDEQQLPPYDLYQTKIETFDEDSELTDDNVITSESLLQFAHSSLETVPLRGHYRSLFPELIMFSNQHFYDGLLETIPLAKPEKAYEPVISYIKIEGSWENLQNKLEAVEVLNQLQSALTQYPNDSIGIITFNFMQQELILNELENHLTKIGDAVARERIFHLLNQGISEEKLFIKNIENVQGDERDIIILSTGYAPDKNKKLRFLFGSLSRAGGEKRLNVAITRARKKLILVTSLSESHFASYAGNMPGVQLLGKFLGYAQQISLSLNYSQNRDNHSIRNNLIDPIITFLIKSLLAKNVPVAQQVGVATQQVDLALMHPKFPNHYVLGIWVDGSFLFSRKNSYDRILFQPAVFQYRKWKLLFISARSFWLNPESVVQKIIHQWEANLQHED
ncbi:MAG: DUF4011 domain-containing protein [Bacteroidia bacterium]|nr:DUF4011 domain-containing protein [Bacteroidia bacterium]